MMTVPPRALVLLWVGVSALGVSACTSSGETASAVTTSAAPTTSVKDATHVEPPFVVGDPPANTVVLRGGLLLLEPPGVLRAPEVTATMAFRRCRGGATSFRIVPPLIPPTVELTRATIKDYGQAHANGSVTPIIGRRLVWIIWYKAQTVEFQSHRAPPGPRDPTATTPILHLKQSIITFVDAHTGKCLNTEGFAPEQCLRRTVARHCFGLFLGWRGSSGGTMGRGPVPSMRAQPW